LKNAGAKPEISNVKAGLCLVHGRVEIGRSRINALRLEEILVSQS